jgi:hypothetical protein
MYRVLVLACLALSYSIGPQSVGITDRRSLIKDSPVIVTGVVQGEWWVVNQGKMDDALKRPTLPNPADYVVGRSVRLRVDHVVKRERQIKLATTIDIFIPGWSFGDGTPAFVKGQRYLVLLSQLKVVDKSFDNTAIYNPLSPASAAVPFVPTSSYTVAGNELGAIQFTPSNRRVIEQIKASARKAA